MLIKRYGSSTYHSIINSRFKQSSPQASAPFERSSLGSTGHSHCILLISRWDLLFFLKNTDANVQTHRFLSRCCVDQAGHCFTSQSGRDSPQSGQSTGASFWFWSAPSISWHPESLAGRAMDGVRQSSAGSP